MKLRKILSVVLTAALVGTSAAVAVSAQEVPTEKTYNYVALGDSIGAGYGLTVNSGELAIDRALVINEDLLANPIEDAYSAVFGTYLEALAQDKNIAVNTTNLCATAYRAEDVEQTILTDGYKGEIAVMLLESVFGKGKSALLEPYHDIFTRYLSEADLVSVQLGGNDIMMGILIPMLMDGSNPVTQAISISLVMLVIGYDAQTALGAGLMTLDNNKDKITQEMLMEAAEKFVSITQNVDMYVDNAANNVKKVLEAVKTVNDSTEIAVLGMFNPFGNSLECDGKVYSFSNTMTNIFARALELLKNEPIQETEVVMLSEKEVAKKAYDFNKVLTELKGLHLVMEQMLQKAKTGLSKLWTAAYELCKAKMNDLLVIVKDELSYPLQYLLAGQSTEPVMKSLNEKLAAIADEEDAVYVDVYGISNENNLDPHPMAKGHREIADFMLEALEDTVQAQLAALDSFTNVSTISAEQIKLGEKVKVRGIAKGGSGDYQYAFYYKKASSTKWTRVLDFSTVRAVNIKPTTAVTYDVLVKVKDSSGNIVSKTFTLRVTK